MSWQQIFSASNPTEHEELLLEMFRIIEARQRRWILVRGRLFHERRRLQVAHFVSDRRLRPSRAALRLAFMFILVTVSVTVWLIAATAQARIGAPIILIYNLFLLAIVLIKPYRRISLTPYIPES